MAEAFDQRRRRIETYMVERGTAGDGRQAPPTTPGERQLRMCLTAPITEADEMNQVEADVEALIWRPSLPPSDELMFSKIGLPDDSAPCFACNNGLAADLPIHSDQVERLRRVMEETRAWNSELQWAQNVHRFYESDLRQPSMLNPDNRHHLPEWALSTIIAHMRSHIKSPEAIVAENVRKLDVMIHHLYTNGMFVKNMGDPSLQRMNLKYTKMGLDLIKAQMEMMKSAPSKMFGYASNVSTMRTAPYGNQSNIASRSTSDSQQTSYVPMM